MKKTILFAHWPKRLILNSLLASSLIISAEAVSPPPDGGYPGGNTAEGLHALLERTTGTYNTAVGLYSLLTLTSSSFNTAIGAGTLLNNLGSANTATGAGALLNNTIGSNNTANGESALFFNTTGGGNTATGFQAMVNNTTGGNNTATGFQSLRDNTSSTFNTAVGVLALANNTSGSENTALGGEAGRDQTTGSGNVYIGRAMIGVPGENNKTYIRNINSTALNGAAVTVDVGTGVLGHVTSSRRYKDEIRPMDHSSEALYQLKPVTFRYKKEIDRAHALSFGLIAEEVAKVNPDLIVRDTGGRPETVRYEAVNAMLLNEFLKEHHHVREQDAIIARQQKQIDALTSGLQKMSAQLEASKPASQVAIGAARTGEQREGRPVRTASFQHSVAVFTGKR